MSAQMHVVQQTLQRVENMEHRACNYEQLPPYRDQWNGYYQPQPPALPWPCPPSANHDAMLTQHPTSPPKVPLSINYSNIQTPKRRSFLKRKSHTTPVVYQVPPRFEMPQDVRLARMVPLHDRALTS